MIIDFLTEFVGIPLEDISDPVVQSYAYLSGCVIAIGLLAIMAMFLMALFNINRRK